LEKLTVLHFKNTKGDFQKIEPINFILAFTLLGKCVKQQKGILANASKINQ
jgi:hypothetical protein